MSISSTRLSCLFWHGHLLFMFQQTFIIHNLCTIGNNHLAFAYAMLAVIAIVCTLSGFLADVCSGRS